MPGKKQIEDSVRTRFIQAVDQLNLQDDLNIEKIMESVGDYQQAYTQMNSGKRYPTLKNIVLLCQGYGVNANWLLFGIGENGLQHQSTTPLQRLKILEQDITMLKHSFIGNNHKKGVNIKVNKISRQKRG
jgi:hypothetical protein